MRNIVAPIIAKQNMVHNMPVKLKVTHSIITAIKSRILNMIKSGIPILNMNGNKRMIMIIMTHLGSHMLKLYTRKARIVNQTWSLFSASSRNDKQFYLTKLWRFFMKKKSKGPAKKNY